MSSRLIEQWRVAASDLGLDIQIPFSLFLISGACVNADLLLRRFGYTNGMLIITDYSKVAHISAEITEAGYGYSTLAEPRDDENYNRDEFIEMLRDWGWAGSETERPHWCTPIETDADQ